MLGEQEVHLTASIGIANRWYDRCASQAQADTLYARPQHEYTRRLLVAAGAEF